MPEASEAENWYHFVRTVLPFLRPPQIVELLLWMWDPSRRNLNRPMFLQRLGMFDYIVASVQFGPHFATFHRDYIDMPECFSLYLKENYVESSIAKVQEQDGVDLTAQWKGYRRNRWSLEARGRLFFQDPTAKELFLQMLLSQMKI
jgi:hypothetical protein